jgi:hypothetical protein
VNLKENFIDFRVTTFCFTYDTLFLRLHFTSLQGIAGMKKGYHLSRNDTCHVFKLTDQQRHDIHTPQGEISVQV